MNEFQHGPHIRVYQDTEGHPCVSTDDNELLDVIDDYLTEGCDFNFHANYDLERKTVSVESGITYSQLTDAIANLDLDEIERIYLLNNTPKST
jgi:hypothetical protein